MSTLSVGLKKQLCSNVVLLALLALPNGPFCVCASPVQKLPDLYTLLFPGINFGVSPDQVLPGETLVVNWSGANNGTYCIPEDPYCPEFFGPAFGPWEDAVFLFNDSTSWLLGTATFGGYLLPHGGYDLQGSFQIPLDLPPGVYGVEIRIDYLDGNDEGRILEHNTQNNADRVPGAVTVLPRPSFTSVSRGADGKIHLQLTGSLARQVRIQSSPSLSSDSWTDLVSFTDLTGSVEYTDNTAPDAAIRFYRAVSP